MGDRPGGGASSGLLDKGLELFKEGGLCKVATECPRAFVIFHKGLTALERYAKRGGPEDRTGREIIWIWGGTGTGKSFLAREYAGKFGGGIWSWFGGDLNGCLNNYCEENVALFDDFRYDQKWESILLKLTDVYPVVVNVKYGEAVWDPKVVIFTSPYPWTTALAAMEGNLGQFERRITVIVDARAYEPERNLLVCKASRLHDVPHFAKSPEIHYMNGYDPFPVFKVAPPDLPDANPDVEGEKDPEADGTFPVLDEPEVEDEVDPLAAEEAMLRRTVVHDDDDDDAVFRELDMERGMDRGLSGEDPDSGKEYDERHMDEEE
jgi:hypothetical protein